MFLISVEWLDDAKTRARFSLPGREEWRAEHLDALMQVLAQLREQMSPADVSFNIRRLRAESGAKSKHADLLERWWESRKVSEPA